MREALGQYMARDGKTLYFRKWHAPGDIIIYLHGIESHSDWFSSFAARLADSGFCMYGIDRRGSGLNYENRGDIKDYNTFINDIEDAIIFVKSKNPGKSIYLMGICWGAFLAVNYVLRKHTMPNGLIMLSPAIYRKIDLRPATKVVCRVLAFFYPKCRFKIPIRDDMFTQNKRYRDFIKNDKMRLRSLTGRFFREILKLESDFAFSSNEFFLPVLVLLAGHDEIVDNDRIRRWFNTLPMDEKTIRTFADFWHVMPFEEDTSSLLDAISDWTKERELSFAGQSQNIKN